VVTVDDIKNLREATGAGVMDCKKALAECGGDVKEAGKWLQERGVMKAADRSGRVAKEGVVEAYLHNAGRIGVLVEINCETDFVARNEEFKQFAHDVAMHIAAADPLRIAEADLTDEDLAEVEEDEKADFLKANVLLLQPYIRDESRTIGELLIELVGKTGENVVIRRFTRFALGQGE
jgi:elongation factor Ts